MADIFISYKHQDIAIVKSLAFELDKSGWSVWWDHDIPAGKDYDLVIEEALNAAKCVIVLWSVNSINSRNVKDEANVALERGILIPVAIGNIRPPMGFRMIQTIIWQDDDYNKGRLDELIAQIKNLIGSRSSNAPQDKQMKTQDGPGPFNKNFTQKGYGNSIQKKYIYYTLTAASVVVLILYAIFHKGGNENIFTGTVLIDEKPVKNVIVSIAETNSTAKTDASGRLSIPYNSKSAKLSLRFSDSAFALDTLIQIEEKKLKEEVTFHLIGNRAVDFGPPDLLSPKDRQSFNIFPRVTKLVWRSVSKAKSYNVEIQMGNFATNGDIKWYPLREVIVSETVYTFDFVGAQPGRWRVYSINDKDESSAPSSWRLFNYLK